MISDFRRELDENCPLLGFYATSSGNFSPKFRDNISVPSSSVKNTDCVVTQQSAVLMHLSVSENFFTSNVSF